MPTTFRRSTFYWALFAGSRAYRCAFMMKSHQGRAMASLDPPPYKRWLCRSIPPQLSHTLGIVLCVPATLCPTVATSCDGHSVWATGCATCEDHCSGKSGEREFRNPEYVFYRGEIFKTLRVRLFVIVIAERCLCLRNFSRVRNLLWRMYVLKCVLSLQPCCRDDQRGWDCYNLKVAYARLSKH